MNATDLIEFSRTHRAAGEFLVAATDDYAGCRCCLLNGLFSGLRLGAETVEKHLKACILYADPVRVIKGYNHRIKHLASAASDLEPRFNPSDFTKVIDRLEIHYRQRYPDVTNFDRSASTGELVCIDELVLHIWECLPIPDAPKFRSYGYYFFVCCPWAPPTNPHKKWLEQENGALQPVKTSLVQRFQTVEARLQEH